MTQPIRRSVWSFWSKPYYAQRKSMWVSEKYHWFAWVLSVERARQHYPETVLFTDEQGARILVDSLQLPFTEVHTGLNQLDGEDPDWWMLGKLFTYRQQTQPFVHIDADVFLWKSLPQELNTAPVLVQNPETFVFGNHEVDGWWYRPEIFDAKVKQHGGWLPPEWEWYVSRKRNIAFCTGIFGGHDLAFIHYYADQALKVACEPKNRLPFCQMNRKQADCILIEQYLLAACVEYHQQHSDSSFHSVKAAYLFESAEQAHIQKVAKQKGYTHLIAGSKQDPYLSYRLEKRVKDDYPAKYKQCLDLDVGN